jgi:hypothetical protein
MNGLRDRVSWPRDSAVVSRLGDISGQLSSVGSWLSAIGSRFGAVRSDRLSSLRHRIAGTGGLSSHAYLCHKTEFIHGSTLRHRALSIIFNQAFYGSLGASGGGKIVIDQRHVDRCRSNDAKGRLILVRSLIQELRTSPSNRYLL